jgi:ABC-type dipeptide/oligopeptide/nickel transport system permease component
VLMAKAKTSSKKAPLPQSQRLDSVYLLKLVLYLILGSQWLIFENTASTWQLPIPIGLIIGVLFAMHDHFKIDRKIEYAMLLMAMFVGFWAHIGLYVTLGR